MFARRRLERNSVACGTRIPALSRGSIWFLSVLSARVLASPECSIRSLLPIWHSVGPLHLPAKDTALSSSSEAVSFHEVFQFRKQN